MKSTWKALLIALATVVAGTSRAATTGGKIVVAEVYGGGGSGSTTPMAPYTTDFVVLFNSGVDPVDISGWSIQYQAATSTGSIGSSNRTNITSGTINPGQYFLVIEGGSGSATGTPAVPIPGDFTGTIGLSNGAGKVFLVSNQTAIVTAGTATAATITTNAAAVVDQVSYGTANLAEGGASAPGLTRFSAVFRKSAGYIDTDNNANDFALGSASALNSSIYAKRAASAAAVHSSPTAFSGGLYYGADDGKVYGVSAATNTALPGFPFDARANGAMPTSKVLGRVSLKMADGVLRLFFVTNDGYAFCLNLDGSKVWSTAPLVPGATTLGTTPAVLETDDSAAENGMRDYVFIAAGNGSANSAAVFKLRADNGAIARQSLPLGSDAKSSPAAAPSGVYVGMAGNSFGAFRLDPVTLTVQAQIGAGTTTSSAPFVAGVTGSTYAFPVAYTATDAGDLYAQNAVNGTTLTGFPLTLEAGASLCSPFYYSGYLYIGSSTNKLYKVAPDTGTSTLFYDSGTIPGGGGTGVSGLTTPGAITGGVAVDPPAGGGPGAIIFGSSNGFFYEIPLNVGAIPTTAKVFGPISPLNTAAAVDTSVTGVPAVAIGADDGNVYRFSRF